MSDEVAHARSSDPETSHEAAASVGDLKTNQAAVLDVLYALGPVTDETLILVYQHEWSSSDYLPQQSPSGIRSRRSELVKQGLVAWTGYKVRVSTGRHARLWAATSAPRTTDR